MKLKNRQQDNYFEFDEAIMRGEIEMTEKEWSNAFKFLHKEYDKAVKNCITEIRDGLNAGFLDKDLTGKMFSIGITATKLLVDRYKLKNYKDVNYLIVIK